jgi:hypothetical protein
MLKDILVNVRENSKLQSVIVVIAFLAVLYNAILAVINGHLFSVNYSIVVMVEIVLLAIIMFLITTYGFIESDFKDIAFLTLIVLIGVLISMLNQQLFVDSIRNFLIVVLFYMLGKRTTEETIHKVFFVISIVVGVILLLEMFSLDSYAWLLQPAEYFANTRGISERAYNETGLFAAALGFDGRFNYGLFSGPRTSSVFLEQVSLSNFAIVLSIYLATFWQRITKKHIIYFVTLIVLILVTSRSRSALGLVVISFLGYHLIPFLSKRLVLIIFPMGILMTIMVYLLMPTDGFADTLQGRLSYTGDLLYNIDIKDIFALDIANIKRFGDSGFVYLINANTLFGAIATWLYVATAISANNSPQLRLLFLSNTYFFATLAVSGTSVFSIKTAALLWLMIGFMSMLETDANNDEKMHKRAIK